jgi:hypothetical protein
MYELRITANDHTHMNKREDIPGEVTISLPDTGGKTSHPTYITTKAYGCKPKTFALVVTQDGFIKVQQ